MDTIQKLIIIGSGPAGYTAAIYAARAGLRPLVVEGVVSGGALMTTTEVENFPGFPEGILGQDLMESMRRQAERFGARFITDDATKVELTGPVKSVWVDEAIYKSQAVILATGSAWRSLDVPGERELLGRGVSSCATCDGFFFRGHNIAVIGGGDSALEEALFLTRFAESVTIVHRRDQFRASTIMSQRALANDKIKIIWDSTVTEIISYDDKVGHITLRHVKTGEKSRLDVTGVFIAIGHNPRSELFKGQVERDEEGYVIVDSPHTHTSIVGVFAAGDLVDHTFRQAITAAGTGCSAALDAERYLASLN